MCDGIVSDTGKKSDLGAYLRTQALLLGEILLASIVLHKIIYHIVLNDF